MSDKFSSRTAIAMLNIAHLGGLLRTALDERERSIVERLLANEKAKLNESLREDAKRGDERTRNEAHPREVFDAKDRHRASVLVRTEVHLV